MRLSLWAVLRCILSLVLSLATARGSTPPEQPEQPEQASEVPAAEPSLEDAQLMVARDLHARGEAAFREADYRAAIEAWVLVLVLMPDKQADLRVPLAHAHRRAYGADRELEHLRTARKLFTEQLASLGPQDAVRGDIEMELVEIEAELSARAAAEAEARAARDQLIREEQIRINQQQLAATEAARQRSLQRVYYGVGGSATGIGLGLSGVMVAALVAGARLERDGHESSTMVGVPDGYYLQQLAKGQAQNRIALASGIVGGLLTSAGVTLLSVALARRKRVREHAVRAGLALQF